MRSRNEQHGAACQPGFEVRVRTDIGPDAHEVVPFVDGAELTALVTAYEKTHAMKPAGGYGGIIVEHFDFGDLAGYFEGSPTTAYWTGLGRIALLGCDCGEVGCWPLYVTVVPGPSGSSPGPAGSDVPIGSEWIRWSGFAQPHRPNRDYGGFGPFVFDATRYRDALSEALAALAPDVRGGR